MLAGLADTLRERGDAPWPGQVDRVGWYRVFPDGVPDREERRVLDLRMLAQGAYFVTVKTPTYTSTRKLVVE